MQQQVITTTVNQPVVQAEGSQDYRVYHKYRNQTSLVLGAVQVVIGLLCIFFNLAAILLGASYGKVAHGFWCGIFVSKDVVLHTNLLCECISVRIDRAV